MRRYRQLVRANALSQVGKQSGGGGGGGGAPVTLLSDSKGYNAFIVKYNSSLSPVWTAVVSGSGQDQYESAIADSDGNIVAGGDTASTSVTVYNSDNTPSTTMTKSGTSSPFLVKYNSSGQVQWAFMYLAGTGSNTVYSIYNDSANNIYVGGRFGATSTINNVGGSEFSTITYSRGGYIIKYDQTGNGIWKSVVINGWGETTVDCVINDSFSNVIVSGWANNRNTNVTPINADNGQPVSLNLSSVNGATAYIVKYNSSGTAQWIGGWGGASASSFTVNISRDSVNNIYATSAVAAPGGGMTLSFYSAGNQVFSYTKTTANTWIPVVKYNSDGIIQWVSLIPGYFILGITCDSSDNILVGFTSIYWLRSAEAGSKDIYNGDNTRYGSLPAEASPRRLAGVVKYNSSGMIQWIAYLVATSLANESKAGNSIRQDSFGNTIMNFSWSGVLYIYHSDGNLAITLPNVTAQSCTVKYNPSGRVMSVASTSGTPVTTFSLAYSTDAIVVGTYNSGGTVTVNPGTLLG